MKTAPSMLVGLLLSCAVVSTLRAEDIVMPLPAPVPEPATTALVMRVHYPSLLGCVRVLARPTTNGVEFGRALDGVTIAALMDDGTESDRPGVITKLNAPIEAWSSDLRAAAQELGLDWATATGTSEIAIASRALLRVIGARLMSGPTLDAWVAATHAGLMAQLAAQISGTPQQ